MSVRPASVRVVVAGPASLLRTLTPADVNASVDGAAAAAGGSLSVTVDFSPGHAGLSVKEVSPASVTVRANRPTRKGT
jgi:hypothetical protein